MYSSEKFRYFATAIIHILSFIDSNKIKIITGMPVTSSTTALSTICLFLLKLTNVATNFRCT